MKNNVAPGAQNVAIHGVGRRKKSVARVWLKRNGKGSIIVNGKDYATHFDTDITRSMIVVPLGLTKYEKMFDIQVNVEGGGIVGQAGATQLGISRALLSFDETLRVLFRQNNLLTVDSRIKERKKYGQKAARRKFQFVKR